MANPLQKFLKGAQQSWVLLAQAAVWVAGALTSFLLPPPSGTLETGRVWVRFAQFMITMVIGLIFLTTLRWNKKKDVARWGVISAGSLVLATAAFFAYQIAGARWTATYDGATVLIGGTYTAWGAEYQQANPNYPPSQLIHDAAGKVEKIWTPESIEQRRVLLAGMYVLATPLFTICIMSLVQAIQCASSKAPRRKRSTGAGKAALNPG